MKTTEEKIEELEKQLQELKAEIKPKFKKGDFVCSEWLDVNCISIFSRFDGKGWLHYFFADKKFPFNGSIGNAVKRYDRLATEAEKQLLLDKLHEIGKDWDAEKCEIVDYRWRAKDGEAYYFIDGLVCRTIDYGLKFDDARFSAGNYFKTYELAESAAEKVKELLLTLKHS